MKKIALIAIVSAILFSCTKSKDNNTNNNGSGPGTGTTVVTDSMVINDFVQKIALPQYANLYSKAVALNVAVQTLNTSPTKDNLTAAQQAWRDTRTAWETCEGFLFGPVEDNDFDPNMDTWPVDYVALDNFIATSASFSESTIASLSQSLKGFHPLEFILWGQSGNATVDSITDRQKQYMISLSQDIVNITDSLNNSWDSTGGNFQKLVLTAGKGSTRFSSRQDALLAIVNSMSDICDEVGRQGTDGKIYDPYASTPPDSTKTESPFSHNSMIDFRNNIIGAQNVYLCTYNGVAGSSISNLVAAKNLSLDNKIKQQFTAAITALNNVTVTFEKAIFTQRAQLLAAMTALNTLQATLDGDLKTFIMTNVKD